MGDNKRGLLVFFLILILCTVAPIFALFVWPQLSRDMSANHYVLHQVLEEEFVYALEVKVISVDESFLRSLREQGVDGGDIDRMRSLNDVILSRLVLLDGSGRCIPKDCGYFPVLPNMGDVYCGKPKTVRVVVTIVNPRIHAVESGVKTKILHLDGIRAIGEERCEVGPLIPFEDESQNQFFNFFDDILNQTVERVQTIPNCTIGIYASGDYRLSQCADELYYETQSLVGIGPVPEDGQGLYLYTVSANGLKMYNTRDFPELFALNTAFRDAVALTEDDLRNIDLYLMQVEAGDFLRTNP